jgi:Uma2 family endonuclease
MGLPQQKMTLDEFMAWEHTQAERHEFILGETYAMVGARRVHGRVVMNLGRALGNALEGSRCEVYAETMKVRIPDANVVYPDLFITCDPADLRTEQVFEAPTVVIEVLSPSTESHDRGLKFALYRRLPSLKEYVLIDPDSRQVEVFRRNEAGIWELHDQTPEPALGLASLALSLSKAELFAGLAAGPAEAA